MTRLLVEELRSFCANARSQAVGLQVTRARIWMVRKSRSREACRLLTKCAVGSDFRHLRSVFKG